MFGIIREMTSLLFVGKRCPSCHSFDVKVERVKRPPLQRDGLDGYRFKCRKCGNVWVKPLLPCI